jgi:hypothetical protein
MYLRYTAGMRFKPALTKAVLQEIQDRNPTSPDVRALLWEVARLRGLVLRADQLQRSLGTMSGPHGAMLESLRNMLAEEPCVVEFPKLDGGPPR